MSSDQAPGAAIEEDKSSASCALLGRDYPGIKFRLLVEEGDRVRAGQPVMTDRRRPHIQFNSACAGVVKAIHRGSGRRIISVEITNDKTGGDAVFKIPDQPNRKNLTDLMLESGLWVAMRSRPFDVIADPDARPEALLVTAIDTRPLAPNPTVILFRYSHEFSTGLRALCELVDAPVYLCKPNSQNIERENGMPVKEVEFNAQHPAGLVGTHISTLCPIRLDGNQVWHIGYQDVISLGILLTTGKPWFQRVISIAGSAVRKPRLISVPLGADVNSLIEGELVETGPERVFSGSSIDGREARGYEAFLGRYHGQVTVNRRPVPPQQGWLDRLLGTERTDDIPLIALPDLDRMAPPGILAVPLLRALLVGDIERARDLGVLGLVEDDMALLSQCCVSGKDYGQLLRQALNQIEREGLQLCR